MRVLCQAAIGTALQKVIDARARDGVPVCPNRCRLPYDPRFGHMDPGYRVTFAEELCLATVREPARCTR